MADDSTSATPAPDTAPAQSPALLTIPQFAAGIKRRVPELQSLPDAMVARRALESHPELIHSIRTFEPRRGIKPKQEQPPSRSLPETQIKAILGNKRYEDLSFEEKTHVLSLGFKAYAQREQGKAHGDNTQWLSRATHWVKSLLGETGGVAVEATGAATNPKNAAVMATGIVDPAIPATIFAVQGATALPGQIKEAQAHPSPENVQAPLLTGSVIAGGAAGAAEEARQLVDQAKTTVRAGGQMVAGAGQAPIETAVREHGTAVRAQDAEHAAATDIAKSKYIDQAAEHRAGKVAASKAETQRAALKQIQDSYADKTVENVKATHKAVRGKLDERWNGLREKVGVDAPVKAPPLYNAVEAGRAMLAGVPADLKLFNDIIKEVTEKGEKVENEQGELKSVPKESIPFDDARTQFSAVGEKAYAAQGNLRRALFTLYDAYDKELNATASAAGQGKEYGLLKGDWKQYMQDWHDMGSMATGGSPLARLYRANALDKDVINNQVTGKFGDRLMQTFGKYRPYGADPSLPDSVRRYNAVEKALPKTAKVPAKPEYNPPSTPEPVKPVDPFRIRLKKMEDLAGSPLRFMDFFPPRLMEKLISDRYPKFREWVASQPRPNDPDYIPRQARTVTPSEGNAVAKEIARNVKQFDDAGMSALKDYTKGSITQDGFRQRLLSLFPNMSAAEVDTLVGTVDKYRSAAGRKP